MCEMSSFQKFLHDFAFDIDTCTMESEEVIPAPNLPDWEETQIIDKEDEQREVALYLSTKNGRVDGAECTPFVLPRRWTYDTLLACVKDYISRTTTNDAPVNIEQLYYKKSKGKAVVKISNDSHIPALIQEYPFCYRNGKKKNSTMYLAVDLKKGLFLQKLMMMQQQMFLNLASSFNMNQVHPSFRTPQTCQSLKKALHEMNADDCINVLQCIGLGKHSESFRANGVNGVLLESLTNPHMGKQMMVNLGLSEENERHILLAEVYRLKSLGYNNLSATPQ